MKIIFCFLFSTFFINAQTKIKGIVSSENEGLAFATVQILELKKGISTNENGFYTFENIPNGDYTIQFSYTGFKTIVKKITIENQIELILNCDLKEFSLLDEVVVTGTKTFKRKTESAVIVNVLDSKTLNNLQVCNLSEGLKFQPGLRVETDCQTCNYTQLRMNGLAGGYSQILINGRPIFSPLTGLYGMEQLPVNMIDRIEVVRGGGSSLYGSSAIGGTVNVITKMPKKNAFELNSFYQNIGNQTNDINTNANATVVNKKQNLGASLFLAHRNRDFYDANGDHFSEIPKITNTSFGTNLFYIPTENQKIEFSLSKLNEYRFGGEMVDKPVFLSQQSEERTHNIWMGSLDYQINFNNEKSTLISYAAWQNTNRDHYTGVFPDEESAIQNHLDNPPYGISNTTTFQVGFQFNHKLEHFLKGSNVLTFGAEYLSDKVFDQIQSYNYLIDQHTRDLGLFMQSDWEVFPSLNLLSGVRVDEHNLINQTLFSPRFALLFKPKNTTQFRLSYGTGFRAPQAFDTDLHIAFAGGGVSRVIYDPNLKEERSQSWSASVNYDKATENFIVGYTFEGFFTKLSDAFMLENIGTDEFGEIFEKRNGIGAIVKGITVELRGNYKRKIQLETGFTIQKSQFENAVTYVEGINPTRNFLRTPNEYGFANLTINPTPKINLNLNYVFTGSMKIAHFAGAPNQLEDEFVKTKTFSEVNSKIGYTITSKKYDMNFEIYGGLKNIFNQYQSDFDIGKNRDSNYIYGPSLPRTVFIGLKINRN